MSAERWVKLDVDFTDHPKVLEAGPLLGWAYIVALTWSRRHLTDGLLSYAAMHHAYTTIEHYCGEEMAHPEALAEALVDCGLLDVVEANGEANRPRWAIHDYSKYQQTKQMVHDRKEELSRIRSEAGRKGGEASGEARRSKTNPRGRERDIKNPPNPPSKGGKQNASQETKPGRTTPALTKRDLATFTGCKSTRGTHGNGWKHTTLGTDKPPPDWPYPKPTEPEILEALTAARNSLTSPPGPNP